jgi:3-oxoacyl-(acyl-carrier-protein) synthase
MKAFIKGTALISPQKTFGEPGFPDVIMMHQQIDRLLCVEPAYRDFIDPMASRRMSRIVKMGVCAALKCIRDSGVAMPDAIVAGTGLGCLEDTEKFLGSVYAGRERLLNPTPFIQSTHNTVAGAVALAIKCHGYNATYVHRGFSFESALGDALLQLEENPASNILTGSFDELTTTSYRLTRRMGLWKNHPVDTAALRKYATRGSIPGEGVAFFMLSGEQSNHDLAIIRSLHTFYKPQGEAETIQRIGQHIYQQGLDMRDFDLVITGINGDPVRDQVYYTFMGDLAASVPCAFYKNLCGEYDTSASFALWLAVSIMQHDRFPEAILLGDRSPDRVNRILLYNHLHGNYHTLLIVERC